MSWNRKHLLDIESLTEEEVLTVAVRHAVEEHGRQDTPELRKEIRLSLIDEPAEVHA